MKLITVCTLLLSSLMLNSVYAKDALTIEPEPIQQPVQSDQHIAWHEFRHELISYPRVNAHITHDGIVILQGVVDNPHESVELEELASRVTGATQVVNRTKTK